jgi:hypothetical protein
MYLVLRYAINDRAIEELLKLSPAIRKKVENNEAVWNVGQNFFDGTAKVGEEGRLVAESF